jgi:hypothetical protein
VSDADLTPEALEELRATLQSLTPTDREALLAPFAGELGQALLAEQALRHARGGVPRTDALAQAIEALSEDQRGAVLEKAAGDLLASARRSSSLASRVAELEAEVEKKPRWTPIDVNDLETFDREFPRDTRTRVLFIVGTEKRVICCGWWEADEQHWVDEETDGSGDRIRYYPGEVTHWMPLPEMPK